MNNNHKSYVDATDVYKEGYKLILVNDQGKNFYMDKGQPILVQSKEGTFIYDKNGKYVDITPWSILNLAETATDLKGYVSVITVEDNGLKRKVLFTFPSNNIYDPFETNKKGSILSSKELVKFTDRKVEQLYSICQKLFGTDSYDSLETVNELTSMLAIIDKDASRFLSSVLKSVYYNNILFVENVMDSNNTGNSVIDEKLKMVSVTERQTMEMMESSLNQLIETNNSMWELGCFSDYITNLRVFGIESTAPTSTNIACLTKMTMEDNAFAKSVLNKVSDLSEPNFKELSEFYGTAERFIREQRNISNKNKLGIGRLEDINKFDVKENIIEFLRTFLSIDEAELHNIAKQAQEEANKYAQLIGQPGRN